MPEGGAAGHVLEFHNGRGSQERLFAEAKQHAAMDLILTRRRIGNELFTLAGVLAHNLTHELQITRPHGTLALTLNDHAPVRRELTGYLDALHQAA